MKRPLSLAVRLTASIGVVITAVLLSFGWMVERSINQHFIQQDVDELNAAAQALRHALALLPPDKDDEAPPLAQAAIGQHNVHYRITLSDGSLLYQSPDIDLTPFAGTLAPVQSITADTLSTWKNRSETFRGAAIRVLGKREAGAEPMIVTVATRIDFHLRYLEDFRRTLGLITLAACLLALFASWCAVLRGHAPIRRLSREIQAIQSDQLHVRLNLDTVPGELTELAGAFNQTLGRLEDVFKRLSEFSGDIAHELRTPITNLRTQTEVALSRTRTVEQYREILYSNLEEYERMARMVDDMLFLAQADNKLLKPESAAIDLYAEIEMLFDYFGAWAEDRHIDLRLKGEPVGTVGDRPMIRRALSNLLANAIQHTPARGTILVQLHRKEGAIEIQIRNPGPSIPAEHIPHIFERFYRPDASRQRTGGGIGLGLAIVRSIIEAHSGTISVISTTEATEFQILLPASPEGSTQNATPPQSHALSLPPGS
ncbi:heavy metal sensor histidine kinase [Castellaniella defragrans]|uniref:Sensor protein n=1 Tax=Castellaniella defragrans TaxID=75697 RepID=A0A7W9WR07_CASDE|nr:heavy metal sensor histidine kinase [Castellaniella defragrans]KAB0599104.1 heavy metal sensor histidine kinase [Castellaniella defragrans]MBB6085490.1 two-component system heavy metal sensor histidine kinase CusS [Castellaniella defragrans]